MINRLNDSSATSPKLESGDKQTEVSREVLIVTGMSGAGRSHAGSVLEDVGWFVVDNLPPRMILPLVDMMLAPGSSITRIATVVDMRLKEYFGDLDDVLKTLQARNVKYRVVFIDAQSEELVKRYERVRRPHPLQSEGGSLLDAIEKERAKTQYVHQGADIVLDTTYMSIHDLSRSVITSLGQASQRQLSIHVMSFGFKHGIPFDAEFAIDMRWLPNPFWIDELKSLTGTDERVQDYVFSSSDAKQFLKLFIKTSATTFSGFLHENKPNLTVAFGCTGGKHRSVAFASEYVKQLKELGYTVSLTHRDIGKD